MKKLNNGSDNTWSGKISKLDDESISIIESIVSTTHISDKKIEHLKRDIDSENIHKFFSNSNIQAESFHFEFEQYVIELFTPDTIVIKKRK